MHLARLCLIWGLMLGLAYLTLSFAEIRGSYNTPIKPINFTISDKLIAENKKLLESKEENVASQVLLNAIKTLKKAPLNGTSLLDLYAVKKLSDPTLATDTRFIEEAKLRNPRNRTAIIAAMQQAEEAGNVSNIIENLDILYRLNAEVQPQILEYLSVLYTIPEGEKIIVDRLDAPPIWARVLVHKIIDQATADNVLHLEPIINRLIPYEQTLGLGPKNTVISRYSLSLIQHGHYNAALNFWTRNQNPSILVAHKTEGLFNPSFQKLPVVPPFNWDLSQTDIVSTELKRTGGLFALFRGEKSASVITQAFRWPENHNAIIKYRAHFEYNKNQGNFSANIRCLNSGKTIDDIVLETSSAPTGIINKSLAPNPHISHPLSEAPNDCQMARIFIMGNPGIYARPISINLDYFEIEFTPKQVQSDTGLPE